MKKVLILVLMSFSLSSYADIKTKEQATQFLDEYCIVVVNEIDVNVKKRKAQVNNKEWDKVKETDNWIHGASDVYKNLCTNTNK